jgi:hypothetical protein
MQIVVCLFTIFTKPASRLLQWSSRPTPSRRTAHMQLPVAWHAAQLISQQPAGTQMPPSLLTWCELHAALLHTLPAQQG